jgi:predicted ATPase/DNA-binding XRE family transcriptional regulator
VAESAKSPTSAEGRQDTFAALLRSHRLAAGLTQDQLAERADLSLRAIQNLERGDRRPYPDTARRLTVALDLTGEDRATFERVARLGPRSRAEPPPLSRGLTAPTNLPTPITACIGRELELSALAQRIREQRLITLFGPGGSGKTRLAVQVGLDVLHGGAAEELFADGVWLVELDAIGEPGLVPHTVATAVGVVEEPGRQLSDTLADALRGRRMLLILDNCEHLVVACAELVDVLLRRCPELCVLATSRQPLLLPGEVVRAIGPLELPALNAAPEAILESASMRLFVERARAADIGLEITPAVVQAMAAICRHLDGIPLALELAAARLRGLSVHDLVTRLDAPFGLLSGAGPRRARHQSLRATIDWSYALLDAPHQRLGRQLSVFSGGWTLSAAEAVCGEVALDGLLSLVDHSLVHVDRQRNDGGGPRYRLLETVRQYLWQQLEAAGEAPAVRDAHLSFYLALAETADAGLGGPQQVECLRRLDAERGNLRSALQWAFSRDDALPALPLAAALGAYWDVRGERSEGLDRLEQALEHDAIGAAEVRARLLRGAGQLAIGTRNEQAAVWLEESVSISREHGDRANQLRALVQLGRVWIDEASIPRAVATLEAATRLAAETRDDAGLAAALSALGQAHLDAGDYAISLPLLERSLALFRRLGDRVGVASTLLILSMNRLEMGYPASAQAELEEAQALLQEIDDVVGVAWTEHNLARLALETGDFERAVTWFESSVKLFQSIGHQRGLAQSLHSLGRTRLALGDVEEAVSLFNAGLQLLRELGHDRGCGWALYNLAWVAAQQGATVRAWDLLTQGLTLFRATAYAAGMAACLIAAALLSAADDPARAACWLGMGDRLRYISPIDRERAELVAAHCAQRLGRTRFDAERTAGRELSAEESVRELDRLLMRSVQVGG